MNRLHILKNLFDIELKLEGVILKNKKIKVGDKTVSIKKINDNVFLSIIDVQEADTLCSLQSMAKNKNIHLMLLVPEGDKDILKLVSANELYTSNDMGRLISLIKRRMGNGVY